MEAVIWLENYLSKWDRILLLISHSQDFLNNVCTHMIHFTNKGKLVYVSSTIYIYIYFFTRPTRSFIDRVHSFIDFG